MKMKADTLYPVIMPIAETELKGLIITAKVTLLRERARQALALSAQRSGLIIKQFLKDEHGAPLPYQGIFWSISHKTFCVAAVVSKERVGIDVEHLLPRPSQHLLDYIALQEEWQLAGPYPTWEFFYRFWTAKEAAVKATGAGLKDMKKCLVTAIPDERHLILSYGHDLWKIEHYWWRNHLISITSGHKEVQWMVLAE